MGVGEKEYEAFDNFRRRVFLPAHREINQKTDLSYHWRPIKTGRKVTSIEFYDIAMKNAPPGTPEEKAIREAMAKVDALTGALGRRLESPYKNARK